MNLDQEISSHLDWIDAVASMLGEDDIPDAELANIARHDQCELGRWLQGEAAAELGDAAALNELVTSHEAFHQLAGRLIAALQQGRADDVEDTKDRFLEKSRQVIAHLRQLKAAHRG
jgi:hypothetical protein